MAADQGQVVLRAERVSKRFGGLLALYDVSFSLYEGEILGLIGPNGAGKTTMINVITGTEKITSGEVFLDGRSLNGLSPHVIAHLGVARTFQIVKVFKELTLLDNVLIGGLFGPAHSRPLPAARKRAQELLEFVGLADRASRRAREVTLLDQKKLQLARALAMEPRVLLLDEVMAGLNPQELVEAVEMVRRINRTGITLLVIEHIMQVVMGLCQRVLVLHHGQLIAEGSPQEIVQNEAVISAYFGERYARRLAGM